MKPLGWLLLLVCLQACATLGAPAREKRAPLELWNQAHAALDSAEFEHALARFHRLAREYPATEAGRESEFYLGATYLDPRNPAWDPKPAEEWLRRYLAADTAEQHLPRRPEARVLLELAQQLNLPPSDRVPGLQPGTKVVERVITTARESGELAAEAERLRKQVAERDEQIRQLQAELERIRRTLTGGAGRRQ